MCLHAFSCFLFVKIINNFATTAGKLVDLHLHS